jgi:outer membrane protein TolC
MLSHTKPYKFLLIFFSIILPLKLVAQEVKQFASVQEIFTYAKQNNLIFKTNLLQSQLADLTAKTAIGNVFNPKIPVSYQAIDNTKMQVSFLPAEIFGGPSGSFKEVQFGQQYNATLSIQPQFEILNVAAWQQIKSAKINQALTENNNKLNEQKLFENINAVYYNILSLQAQAEVLQENLKIATDIKTIVQNRLQEGIARKQELNEAEVNEINIQDKIAQLQYVLQQQQLALSVFFENKLSPKLLESIWNYNMDTEVPEANNNLQVKNLDLQADLLQQDIKVSKYQNLPTASFISMLNYQNVSNNFFYHSDSRNVSNNYIGLKLNWDLPTTVSKLVNTENKKLQLQVLQNTKTQTQLENEAKNKQLDIDYQKANSQLKNYQKIFALKEDTYTKMRNQYQENILALDKLLIAQNDMLVSKLNIITALSNIGFTKNKIIINNQF